VSLGTVTRSNSAGDLAVDLTSSDPSQATVVETITILDGETTSAPFEIRAVDDTLPDGTQVVTITASAGGYASGSATLDVLDHENWQNPKDKYDADNDGKVVPFDALYIVNELNTPKHLATGGKLPMPFPGDTYFYDVNGDGYCTPTDVLVVINFLNTGVRSEGEGPAIALGVSMPDPTASGCLSGTRRPFSTESASESSTVDDRGEHVESTRRLDHYLAMAADAELATIRLARPIERTGTADDSERDLEAILEAIAADIGHEWDSPL
jgi:hypothetical protein